MPATQQTSPVGAVAADLVAFALSGHSFAVPRTAVAAVLPMAALAEPPNRPPALAGFLMLSDMALPVLRTARLLSLPEQEPGPGSALVRLRGGPAAAPRALLVDRALAVLRPPADSWRAVEPAHSFQGLLMAEVVVPGGTVGVLDTGRLLLREEEDRIEAFRALAEERRAALAGSAPGEVR